MNATLFTHVDGAKFRSLFVEELGWNRPDQPPLNVTIDGIEHVLTQVAGYKGVRVWTCPTVPDRRIQRLIDHEVKKGSSERLIIFHDDTHQEWRWPQSADVRGQSQPRLVTHSHYVGKANPALAQRLNMVSLGVREDPTVVELLSRMRRAFDAEKVTNSFYKQFLRQQQALVKALNGIAKQSDREWYSALLMNRLMFVYFMQRKGFMDNDPHYLRSRLDGLQHLQGKGHFYQFYRDLLLPLFHAGLGDTGVRISDPQIKALVGDVPYINGGIFALHNIEAENEITVGDDTFRAIFDLFDQYQWHLDDRPTANPNEINPDVLGYIFEQFINQKEQGAYYTREDVTHFMTASTLVPAFLRRLEEQTQCNPWERLAAEPERYVWESLAFGVEQSLPDRIASQGDHPERPLWAAKAGATHGLPGESWWEVTHRRDVHNDTLTRIRNGEIQNVDQAVTQNLDLESLAVDVIDKIDSPQGVVVAWQVLTGLKIIDPTCGSGAFLFAALKILQVLYSATLDAAQVQARTSTSPELHRILDEVGAHPNRDYFVLKHATLSNLYGVDLMHEAVEVARLRLFLKLVSSIENRSDLEPLPDLDFNIKAGNILVGALTPEDIDTQSDDLLSASVVDDVVEAANEIKQTYRAFRRAQEAGREDAIREYRATLVAKLITVRRSVDKHFHTVQGVALSFSDWQRTHVPFHWFVEYPDVFDQGGFDVVVGNPPYVASKKIQGYGFKGFRTQTSPDIYAPCCERAAQITRPSGRFALIVPISAQFSSDFASLRSFLSERFGNLWVSTFSRNPAALFSAGLGVRSSILMGAAGGTVSPKIYVTKTHRWIEQYRPHLFEVLSYTLLEPEVIAGTGCWPRSQNVGTLRIMDRMLKQSPNRLISTVCRTSEHQLGLKSIGLYWISCYDHEPPSFTLEGQAIPHTAVRGIAFETKRFRDAALAIMTSKVMLMWWACNGDDFNVTGGLLTRLPADLRTLPAEVVDQLAAIGQKVSKALPDHVQYTKYDGKWMGNYVLPEMREITDEADRTLADALGYTTELPDLELFYWSFYKPTGERRGTLREKPDFSSL